MNTKMMASLMVGAAMMIATPVFAQNSWRGAAAAGAAVATQSAGAPAGGAAIRGGAGFSGTPRMSGAVTQQAPANFAGARITQAPAPQPSGTQGFNGGRQFSGQPQGQFTQRSDRDGDRNRHHRGWSGFAAGVAVGSALGGPYYNNNYYYDGGYDNSYAYYNGPVDDGSVTYESTGPSTVEECIATFRSYDIRSQTYLGYDGLRHSCPE